MDEFTWGPWRVMKNPMSSKSYEVYQKREDGEPMHGGNIRIHSTWDSREAAEAVARKLNGEEEV